MWHVEYYSVHAYMVCSQKFRKSEISLDTGNKISYQNNYVTRYLWKN